MTDGTRALLRSLVAQSEALADQATALGMQAQTLKQTVQAMLVSDPPPLPEPRVTTGPGPRHFNVPPETASPK